MLFVQTWTNSGVRGWIYTLYGSNISFKLMTEYKIIKMSYSYQTCQWVESNKKILCDHIFSFSRLGNNLNAPNIWVDTIQCT